MGLSVTRSFAAACPGCRLGYGECPVEASGVKGITRPGLTSALGHMRRGDTLVALDPTATTASTSRCPPSPCT
ncbi:hypothetical protein [Nonomuraea sp. WAC 01424]|uniref:hypothetical protein n=1 Tax=Nonomuraea sp. WAC 01424 TaxID=2203200 RepID=UPI000F78ECF5|nr:hypothetical protein [Nonomuraea sp. WAC 01424]